MSRVITAAQVFGEVRDDQVDQFLSRFNTSMKDPRWVDDWRCGEPGAHFWRFSMHGDHNNNTEEKIRVELDSAGWAVTEVARGADRSSYTCYYVTAKSE